MRTKSILLLVLAVGCGLVASVGILQVLAKNGAGLPVASEDTQTIFVVLKDVGLGDSLTSENLRLEQWPKDKVPAGALTKLEDVEGRRTRAKLYAGEPLLDAKLFRRGASDQGADSLIPKGYRAVSVKVDAVSGAAGLLLPGSRVDVMVYITPNPPAGIFETATRTVLQDIKVFAINEMVSAQSSKEQEGNKAVTMNTISLLVTPEQAAKLTLASELGRIKLVMRSPEDDMPGGRADARPYDLFGKGEVGDRDKETLLDKPRDKGAVQNFLDALNAARAKSTAEAAPPRPVATWNIRLLEPGAVNDVMLEADAGQAAEIAAAGESLKWHPASAAAPETPAKPKAKPADVPARKTKPREAAGPA